MLYPLAMSHVFDPGPSSDADVRSSLGFYANALHLPLSFYRSLFRPCARLLRYGLRKLFGPWMHVQSYFNLSLLSVLERLEQRLHALEKAERDLRGAASKMKTISAANAPPSANRASDMRQQHFQWRSQQQTSRIKPPTFSYLLAESASDKASPSTLVQLCLQRHLPPPPARLLLLSADEQQIYELKRLGFAVIDREQAANASGQELLDAIVAFSVLVDDPRLADAFRRLRRGGRLLFTMIQEKDPTSVVPCAADPSLGDIRIIEQIHLRPTGDRQLLSCHGEQSKLKLEFVPSTLLFVALEKQS